MPTSEPEHLQGGPLNVNVLREHCRLNLVKILQSTPPPSLLLLDPAVSNALSLVAEVELLRTHGVDKVELLSSTVSPNTYQSIVFLARPTLAVAHNISNTIITHNHHNQPKAYTAVFTPKASTLCAQHFQASEVHQWLKVVNFDLGLIPLERDVLSLESETLFVEALLDGMPGVLHDVAVSVHRLEAAFGPIPTVRALGPSALKTWRFLSSLRAADPSPDTRPSPSIDELLLLGRECDLATPLLTQITYEGLIDETYGIKCGHASVEADLVGQQPGLPGQMTKVGLNGADSVYADVRDTTMFGAVLKKKLAEVKEEEEAIRYKERENIQQASVAKIRDFAAKVKRVTAAKQQLSLHINLAERLLLFTKESSFRDHVRTEHAVIMESEDCSAYLDTLISQGEHVFKVLRLLALLSLTSDGIHPKTLEQVSSEIVQTYGYKYLVGLRRMARIGLLATKGRKAVGWQDLRKALSLVVRKFQAINDISYVFSGYAPLSCRLVQCAYKPGWETMNKFFSDWLGAESVTHTDARVGQGLRRRKVVLVFFIGGVSFSEIAALRHFAAASQERTFVIGTTKVINGNSFLDSIVVEPGLL
mmetsp:Transcript_17372/g.44229  ORF Transcript_17372/g.44229 Transcript_17372/m.44229 type:complete len:591 (-) Transcript_17372:194-1966(-)